MTSPPVTIVGSYISPYVRKVLVCLHLKGVEYRIDPIVPFFGDDEFTRISPVRRIPVLIDGSLVVPDSTPICEYLEDRHPEPPLLPRQPAQRARARWLEEFADTRIGEVFIWQLFNQLVINRFVWRAPTDAEVVRNAREQEIPQILDYLEGEVPAQGHLFGAISLADIALAAFFRNAAFAGYTVDAKRWPTTASFVSRVLDHPGFVALRPFEELSLRTPISEHRTALRAAGAPLSERTFGSATARRGILTP